MNDANRPQDGAPPSGQPEASPRGGRCPVCGNPAAKGLEPFCSPRCQDVDLNRWLSGAYVIPGRSLEDDDDGE
ncbi:DNA gyrase inhibitor YacG [Camelimonas abortus]|uniref:DNA gyrase inhibitor YacG n=1 Tax=Camelimonas abortus TaxID=1017184 RepID=A0ABV7LEQ9_9HYPH